MANPLKYPEARRDESVVDEYFGVKVCVTFAYNRGVAEGSGYQEQFFQIADPYRWLEDPDSEETRKYTAAENRVTQAYFENGDDWHKINKKLVKMWNYPKCSIPVRHGDYYFSYRNTGLQNQK